ncbi:DUF2157 domain-containing protein [Flavobacterium phycosphaerae]|uniref:DUF2157 domain-containing protein n=1 Tax=Flavobacterium phycosphaerae TaxID=2697515 RepID=UPI001389E639|nr:DUF2157 domain-containing protein [Flavobacterium phycosphaerae]
MPQLLKEKTTILTEQLVSKDFIAPEQHEAIKQHKALGIFSLHSELLFLVYLSVLLFTSGVGIFVYKNIDSIGHLAILTVNFILMVTCFYFSFKKSKGFSKTEVLFDNPMYDYLVLTGSILACIFIGYVQYQYTVFGQHFGWVSLFSAIFCFGVAYYFDNKSVLSIAITALATFIGITVTPKTLLENEIYSNPQLSYYGLVLGVLLLLWMEYSSRENIKKHFHIIYLTFALNLIGMCCISGLLGNYWFVFVVIMAVAIYYFYRVSYQIASTFILVFSLLYGYVGLNIFLGRLISLMNLNDLVQFLIFCCPFYVIGSIFLFIKLIQKFNREKHAGIQ